MTLLICLAVVLISFAFLFLIAEGGRHYERRTRQECVGGCGRPAVVLFDGLPCCANFAVELMLGEGR